MITMQTWTIIDGANSKNSSIILRDSKSFFFSFSGAFRLYDVDNDGFITRDEMYNIVDAIYQMVVSIMYYLPVMDSQKSTYNDGTQKQFTVSRVKYHKRKMKIRHKKE